MGRMPTRPQPSTSQEHTIGKSALASITGQVFWITAPLFGQTHNQSCIVSSPVEEIKSMWLTPWRNYKAFWAVNCSVLEHCIKKRRLFSGHQWWNFIWGGLAHNDFGGFWAFSSWSGMSEKLVNNSELVNIFRPLRVRRQREDVLVLGVESELYFNTHAHTLWSQDKINAFIAFW